MNAVKYAYPDCAGPIHVGLHAAAADLLLSIADNGVGLNVKSESALHRHGVAHRRRDGDQA